MSSNWLDTNIARNMMYGKTKSRLRPRNMTVHEEQNKDKKISNEIFFTIPNLHTNICSEI